MDVAGFFLLFWAMDIIGFKPFMYWNDFRKPMICIYLNLHLICIKSWHWDVVVSQNYFSWKRRTCLFYSINTMFADGLVIWELRHQQIFYDLFFIRIFCLITRWVYIPLYHAVHCNIYTFCLIVFRLIAWCLIHTSFQLTCLNLYAIHELPSHVWHLDNLRQLVPKACILIGCGCQVATQCGISIGSGGEKLSCMVPCQ